MRVDSVLTKEIKIKEIAQEEVKGEVDRYRQKYEKQVVNCQEAEAEIAELRRER